MDHSEAVEVAGALVRDYYESVFAKDFAQISQYYGPSSKFTIHQADGAMNEAVGATAIVQLHEEQFSHDGAVVIDAAVTQLTSQGNINILVSGSTAGTPFSRVVVVSPAGEAFYVSSDMVAFSTKPAAAPAPEPVATPAPVAVAPKKEATKPKPAAAAATPAPAAAAPAPAAAAAHPAEAKPARAPRAPKADKPKAEAEVAAPVEAKSEPAATAALAKKDAPKREAKPAETKPAAAEAPKPVEAPKPKKPVSWAAAIAAGGAADAPAAAAPAPAASKPAAASSKPKAERAEKPAEAATAAVADKPATAAKPERSERAPAAERKPLPAGAVTLFIGNLGGVGEAEIRSSFAAISVPLISLDVQRVFAFAVVASEAEAERVLQLGLAPLGVPLNVERKKAAADKPRTPRADKPAGDREPRSGDREPRSGDREPRSGDREPRTRGARGGARTGAGADKKPVAAAAQ
jgi:hypothetical protein